LLTDFFRFSRICVFEIVLKLYQKRLKRLIKFSNEWLALNIKNAQEEHKSNLFKNALYERIRDNIKKRTDKMEAIYSLENGDGEKRCGFFDPSTTYGGPQVEEPVRIDKNIENLEKSRKN